MIEQIKQALEKATPAPWSWEGKRSDGGVPYQHILAVGMNNPAIGKGICNTFYSEPLPLEWNGELDIMPATFGNQEDAHLIANAPEYLRYLIGEVEGHKKQADSDLAVMQSYMDDLEKSEGQVKQLQKALERIAVTFERGEMVRIAYDTLRSIKGVETE